MLWLVVGHSNWKVRGSEIKEWRNTGRSRNQPRDTLTLPPREANRKKMFP